MKSGHGVAPLSLFYYIQKVLRDGTGVSEDPVDIQSFVKIRIFYHAAGASVSTFVFKEGMGWHSIKKKVVTWRHKRLNKLEIQFCWLPRTLRGHELNRRLVFGAPTSHPEVPSSGSWDC